ncbi:MAG: protein phosphatase [Bacillales bacterium]|jgi:protein phosphatase|nr:protein phosphatase [Bacillales bacterium]
MKVTYLSDQGKVRKHNEDATGCFYDKNGNVLAIVADGMGGHLAGDVASRMVLDYFQTEWLENTEIFTAKEAENWLNKHLETVNEQILIHANNNAECNGMGTTVVITILIDDFVTIANIGDSRAYVINESSIEQITEDHSLVNELIKHGELSPEDAEHHPRRNILLRALGTESKVNADYATYSIDEKNMLLLCSDGLTNKVCNEDILNILIDNQDIETKALNLITKANDNGGEDNISLVIIDFERAAESR